MSLSCWGVDASDERQHSFSVSIVSGAAFSHCVGRTEPLAGYHCVSVVAVRSLAVTTRIERRPLEATIAIDGNYRSRGRAAHDVEAVKCCGHLWHPVVLANFLLADHEDLGIAGAVESPVLDGKVNFRCGNAALLHPNGGMATDVRLGGQGLIGCSHDLSFSWLGCPLGGG